MNKSTGLDIEQFSDFLRQIQNEDSIRGQVATEALQHDDIPTFFSDLIQHGCVSGMV